MKPGLLRFLAYPARKVELKLEMVAQEGPEVIEGTLSCSSCGVTYPVLRGIPRFVNEGAFDLTAQAEAAGAPAPAPSCAGRCSP